MNENREVVLELIAEHEVRHTMNERSLVITLSKKSGVFEGFYRLVVVESGPYFRRSFCRHNHVGVSPVSCSAESSNPRVWC